MTLKIVFYYYAFIGYIITVGLENILLLLHATWQLNLTLVRIIPPLRPHPCSSSLLRNNWHIEDSKFKGAPHNDLTCTMK